MFDFTLHLMNSKCVWLHSISYIFHIFRETRSHTPQNINFDKDENAICYPSHASAEKRFQTLPLPPSSNTIRQQYSMNKTVYTLSHISFNFPWEFICSTISKAIMKQPKISLILDCATSQLSRGYIYVLCWSET